MSETNKEPITELLEEIIRRFIDTNNANMANNTLVAEVLNTMADRIVALEAKVEFILTHSSVASDSSKVN